MSSLRSTRMLPLAAPRPRVARGQSALPARLKLLAWGANETTKSPIIINDQSAQVFSANQRSHGWERIAIDFEHNTVEGTAAYERSHEPRPVAGFATPEVIRGDGLFLTAVTTTPEGVAHMQNYAALSPVALLGPDGTLLALHSVALCRTGAVRDLTFTATSMTALSSARGGKSSPGPSTAHVRGPASGSAHRAGASPELLRPSGGPDLVSLADSYVAAFGCPWATAFELLQSAQRTLSPADWKRHHAAVEYGRTHRVPWDAACHSVGFGQPEVRR